MEILRTKFIILFMFFSGLCYSQQTIKKLCVNNTTLALDTSWLSEAFSGLDLSIYEDDDIEEHDVIYYYSGEAKVTVYQKENAFWPGAILLDKQKHILQVGKYLGFSPGDTLSNIDSSLLGFFQKNINYKENGKKLPLNRIPSVSTDFVYYVENNTKLFVVLVCFLEEGVIKKIALNINQ